MKLLKTTLKELGFSQSEADIYMALTVLGEAKGSIVAKKSGFTRTTTLSILERLVKSGYITSHKYRGSVYYWVESPAIIEETFKNKAKLAEGLADALNSLYRSGHNFPTIKSFDTKEGIKNFTEKLLLSTDTKEILTIDSPHIGNYQKIFSTDFYKMLLSIKTKKSIHTRTLVPFESKSTIDPQKTYYQDIEIKEMPAGIKFDASIWLIDDTMVTFSGKPPFLIAIKHDLMVKSYKSLFDFLWSQSL
jgi:sugar-specific transcriptional regulator TrmB